MKLSRVLLSGIFIYGGLGAAQQPGGRVKLTQDFMSDLGVDLTEENAELMVRANGAVMVGAGATLALGILPRLSSLALIGSLIPTSVAGHAFWKAEGDAKVPQTIQFLKNLATVGGLVGVLEAGRKR